MKTANINPVELKVFLNHVYEFKKGVRQMVLYTMNKKYEDFAIRRLNSQGIAYCVLTYRMPKGAATASTCFSERASA